MKKFAKALVLTGLLANVLGSHAQQNTYAVIEYMRIPEGQNRDDTLNSYPAGKGQSWDAKLAESVLSKEEWEKARNPDETP